MTARVSVCLPPLNGSYVRSELNLSQSLTVGKSSLILTSFSLVDPEFFPDPEHSPSCARSKPSGLIDGKIEMSVVSMSCVILLS